MNLDNLQGELWATQAAFRVLLLAHPEKQAIATVILTEIERIKAIALTKTVPEETLKNLSDGLDKAVVALVPRKLRTSR